MKDKLLLIVGIPVLAIIGLVIVENPNLWWLAFAALSVVPRMLMRRIHDSAGKSLLRDTEATNRKVNLEPEVKRLDQ